MAGRALMATEPTEQIRNLGDLRAVMDRLVGLTDETPVQVHCGWDLHITEWDLDVKDGLTLFPDDQAGVSHVSTEWLNRTHPEYRRP